MKMKKVTAMILCAACVATAMPAYASGSTSQKPVKTESSYTAATVLEADSGTWHKNAKGWWYVYDNEGNYYKDGAVQIGNATYVFDKNGYMRTGWISVTVPLTKPDGSDNGWGTEWYYADSLGHIKTGWQKISGKWYYLGTDGYMKSGWQKINGKWYYLGSANDGSMKSGWQKINGKWYYLGSKEDGAMKTGWQKIGKYWYYMYSSGEMAAGTTIDGYRVDAQGRWVK